MRTTVAAYLACVGASLSIAPTAALARGHPGSPDSTFSKVYLDRERCAVLAEQFRGLANRIADKSVDDLASRGLELCRDGSFAEGADTLENAIRLVGQTPAKPRPRVLLR
ncbi:MAG TPA: hypothetical protein VGB82_07115 [Alphaproteobacteria bacterium]